MEPFNKKPPLYGSGQDPWDQNLEPTFPTRIRVDAIPKRDFSFHVKTGPFQQGEHLHRREQLIAAESGVLRFATSEGSWLLPARHGIWIPSGVSHGIQSRSPGLFLRCLYFEPETPNPSDRVVVFPLDDLAKQMIAQTQNWRPFDATSAVEAVFLRAIRHMVPIWLKREMALVLPVPGCPALRLVTEHLSNHVSRRLQPELVGRQFGYSKRGLARAFQTELGMSFSAYLKAARVVRAAEMLVSERNSVSWVALEVGYGSLSAFSEAFRSLLGVRPSVYQRQLRNSETETHATTQKVN